MAHQPEQLSLLFDFAGHTEPAGGHAFVTSTATAPVMAAPVVTTPEATPAITPLPAPAPAPAPFPARTAPDGAPTLTLTPAQTAPDAYVPMPCPDPLPAGTRWREVETPQQTIGFILQRSRRRSIGFVIADDGLRVTAPNWVTLKQIDEAVREKAKWILAKLREWQTRKENLALTSTRWIAGGELPYLGKRIVLELAADCRQVFFSNDIQRPQDGDRLILPLPPGADPTRVRDAAQAWLQQRAASHFGARLAYFLQRTGLTIRRWRLSSAATRWGSCTSDGNIMLNWRLIHFAPDIIDYVIVHELAHLREMNHSRDFWAEVGHILPGFEEARQALRQHDAATLP